jgi:hypothetical protein
MMHSGIDDDVFADFLGNCFGGDGAPDGMELVEDLVFDDGPRNGFFRKILLLILF